MVVVLGGVHAENGFQVMDLIKDIGQKRDDTLKMEREGDEVMRFFIIGDYGELSNYFGIRKTAVMMENLAKLNHFEHIITAGDNFYYDGIEDISYRVKPWLVTELYKRDYVEDLDIYPTLGNHD